MTKCRLILILLACGLLAAVLYAVLSGPREPAYKGRNLSKWIASLGEAPPEGERASNAVYQIGTNAVPYLLQWIQYDPSPTKARFMEGLNNAISRLNPDWYVHDSAEARANDVIPAFGSLGSNAQIAIPQLSCLYTNPNFSAAGLRAGLAISHMGVFGVAPLQAALSSPDGYIRNSATLNIRELGEHARPLIPLLLPRLKDENVNAVHITLRTLGELCLDPGLVVPAVSECLRAPRWETAGLAADVLARYGGEARSAVPALLKALTASDASMRMAVTNALLKIAPEALTNDPPK